MEIGVAGVSLMSSLMRLGVSEPEYSASECTSSKIGSVVDCQRVDGSYHRLVSLITIMIQERLESPFGRENLLCRGPSFQSHKCMTREATKAFTIEVNEALILKCQMCR